MELRSGSVVGSHLLPPAAKPMFEEGVRLVFRRWTALALAVENQWGGANTADKANWLVQEATEWFYRNKGERSAGSWVLESCWGALCDRPAGTRSRAPSRAQEQRPAT